MFQNMCEHPCVFDKSSSSIERPILGRALQRKAEPRCPVLITSRDPFFWTFAAPRSSSNAPSPWPSASRSVLAQAPDLLHDCAFAPCSTVRRSIWAHHLAGLRTSRLQRTSTMRHRQRTLSLSPFLREICAKKEHAEMRRFRRYACQKG